MKKILFSILLSILVITIISAQDMSSGQRVQIVLKDGTTVIGKVIEETEIEITLITNAMGNVTIDKEEIKRMTTLQTSNGRDSLQIPVDFHNSTHYLANPSGFTLKKGQSYYENIGVFFSSYAVGVTDNFTIAAGGEVATLLFGQSFPILYVSPRFSIPITKDKHSFSLGGTIFTSPEDGFDGFGVVQAAITIGTRNNNFTIGSGIGFSFEGGFGDEVLPFYASFMTRLSRKFSLVSDNFIVFYDDFNDTTGILSLALRLHFKRNGSAFNFGLFRPTEGIDDLLAIPFVSATIALK